MESRRHLQTYLNESLSPSSGRRTRKCVAIITDQRVIIVISIKFFRKIYN